MYAPPRDQRLDRGSREHYLDPDLYDFEYRKRRADVNYYRALARRVGGPILELGCGSGRALLPLAKDGHTVLGLDLSQPMLRRAHRRIAALGRAARTRAVVARADFRAFAVSQRFPLIICPFNAFQHLYTADDARSFLACVRAALAPGGTFAFDILSPDLRWLSRDPDKRWARTIFKHPTTGRRVEYTTNTRYDPVSQVAFMRAFYREADVDPALAREQVILLAHRQWFPVELLDLVERSGFEVRARHGGFAGEPFSAESESQLLECVQADLIDAGGKKVAHSVSPL